jgi:hypothetical protein
MISDMLGADMVDNLLLAFKYIYWTLPIIMPVALVITVFKLWVSYKRELFWRGLGQVVLEIKLPREILKSPVAMELILAKYWKGQTRSWFSLELVSTDGEIHFYIWTRKKFKDTVSNHLYSQYPGIEVHEVEDYTKGIIYDPEKYNVWGCEYALTQPDPFPIKTYIDYGLDKDPKEEFKIDPMTSMLEFMGSIPHGHHLWFQIIIRAHKAEQRKPGTWFETHDAWKEEAKAEIKKTMEKFRPEDKEKPARTPTEGEKDTISALERSTSKFPFDVGIRTLYIAEKDKFNPGYIGGAIGSFKQYGSPGSNGFKPTGWMSYFDKPWKKWGGADEKLKPVMVDEYKMRRYFFSPFNGKYFYSKPFVLNVEELATIFHFPGQVSAVPTLKRVPSKKSEAPSNLPI